MSSDDQRVAAAMIADLAASGALDDLIEFVIHADHDAGCSGAFGVGYGCKCGLVELHHALRSAGVTVNRGRP